MRITPTLKSILPEFTESSRTESMGILVSTTYSTSKSVFFTRFKGSGTWNKSPSCKYVIIYAWNGGFGGGSGNSTFPANGIAGNGGAGGNSLFFAAPSTFFSSATNITVGAGGLGGAASGSGVTLNPGNSGGVGGQTSIGNISIPFNSIGIGLGGGSGGSGGGRSGSSSYIMSNGYNIIDGTAIGGNAGGTSSTVQQKSGYSPGTMIVGSSTVRIPCNAYAVATGGGGGSYGTSSITLSGNGGDVLLFNTTVTFGGRGTFVPGVGALPRVCQPGTSYANPYIAQALVTGGTGGAGAPTGSNSDPAGAFVPGGGPGGVPGGGGGGGGGGSASPLVNGSGAGGNGGRGEVWIFEFI